MAEALAECSIYSACYGHLPSSLPWGRRNPGYVALQRGSLPVPEDEPSAPSATDFDFHRRRLAIGGRKGPIPRRYLSSIPKRNTFSTEKYMKWWQKDLHPNMKEIESAQDLADSLLNAGEKLVIVDFFTPACGGCRALHPKICQLAKMNPDVLFLQINHEKHKSMCYTLNVHVLPFFRFYRGAHGRLCSFSCTNATIKKLKNALAKHSTLRCSLGPAKGLEESELLALAANKDLSFNYTRKKPDPVEKRTFVHGILDTVKSLFASRR
ncbi:thioredoxin-like 1-2, chloroplastic [Canna indica]|uniref:Thioredoxin-like 1-2, chloroplastic n=1 Tax=Canna indica TaxID=4628 RepID=A0AAQ3Q4N4_9LILI|nr:thioredoxin-like 1-2, chloroplastic [Canna indica]